MSLAATQTVIEEEPKYRSTTTPSEALFVKKTASKDKLLYDLTVGVNQGYDSNVNLDYSKKDDSYTQENVDMHFRYSITDLVKANFGFNVTNVTYYKITDTNILDGIADANLEHNFFDVFTLSLGYVFDFLWYPNDRDGTHVGNEINTSIRQNITDRIYQKGTYRLLFKNFTHRKIRLNNADLGSDLRQDLKNTFEHELGIYLTDTTKLKILNRFDINESNYEYYDYYNYHSYKVGGSIIQFLTKSLYNITGFYYERRNYDSRRVSDREDEQWNNLLTLSVSLLYDITKNASVFINYSLRENHTNEPLEKYSDNIYSTGIYYSF